MEWNGPNNEPGDEPDDSSYPAAPLPPHERAWRHPSEIGERTWIATEPPLVIGRGLLTLTGAVGGILCLAVLWAMLPPTARRDVTALSTVTLQGDSSWVTFSVQTTIIGGGQTAPADSTDIPSSAATTLRILTRPTTVLVATTSGAAQQTTSTTGTDPIANQSPAVAVALAGSDLVVTTALAAGAGDQIRISVAGGSVANGQVIAIDEASGLAVVALDSALEIQSFEISAGAASGDMVTMLGDTPQQMQLVIDQDSGSMTLDDAVYAESDPTGLELIEGTPIVDQSGRLLGLCTHGANGPLMVRVDDIENLLRVTEQFTQRDAWLGVLLNNDPTGALTLAAVDPAGPANASGLVAGDRILSVDDSSLTSPQMLIDLLAAQHPGNTITVQVVHADGTNASISVVLGAKPDSL